MTTQALVYRPTHHRQTMRAPSTPPYVAAGTAGKLIGCTDTVTGMFADAVTHGGTNIGESGIRKLTGEVPPDPKSPGLNLPQAIAALWKLRIAAADKSGETWADLLRYLDQGRYIILQHDMHFLGDGCGDNHVGHCMLLQTRRRLASANGAIRIFGNNPMCPTAKWYVPSKVKEAAEAFGDQTGVPGNGIRFAISRTVPRIAVAR